MARFLKKRTEELGKAPGSLVFVGEKKIEKTQIEVIQFNSEQIEVHKDPTMADLENFKSSSDISWIRVSGIHDTEVVRKIGEVFDLHILLLEDISNTDQRPKYEEFDHHLFLVLKILGERTETQEVISEQFSLVVGKEYLITFQEAHTDVFKGVRDRLLRPTTKIRHRKSDYLAYALMDAIADRYILIIERFGEQVESLEQALIANANSSHLAKLYEYKREINFLRKTIRPVRELVIGYKNSESDLIADPTISYIKDLEDHIVHATEAVETYQVMLNEQLNLYQSITNNRLNDILRVLTIFSVVFIPLTFLAGIYGMNFKYLPELNYRYAYPMFWATLILIAALMMGYFKRKKWL
ncbi:MAG: magnesium/cobalt transporter CorA [Bacteroidota bacterium]